MTSDDGMAAAAKAQADALQAEVDRFQTEAKREPSQDDPDATMAMSAADLLDDDES